jgi:bacterioferritin
METGRTSEGILSQEMSAKRDEIIGLLEKAYFMELETVMSYVANSVNLDGVRAQEVRESLEEDIQEEWATRSSSRPGSRSCMVWFRAR